jgi:MFS superfamily sulfate permease-like transporter
MKAVNLLLALMFVAFAVVQFNDPDPLVWILVYGAMAVICALAAFRYYPRTVMTVLLGCYVVYSFFFYKGVIEWWAQDDKSILFDDIAKMQHPYVEESREFLGLMTCIIVLILHLLLSRRQKTAG